MPYANQEPQTKANELRLIQWWNSINNNKWSEEDATYERKHINVPEACDRDVKFKLGVVMRESAKISEILEVTVIGSSWQCNGTKNNWGGACNMAVKLNKNSCGWRCWWY